MLPVASRTRATTTPSAETPARKITAENSGDGPAAYSPPSMSGTCQSPQITPLTRRGCGTPASTSRVSM